MGFERDTKLKDKKKKMRLGTKVGLYSVQGEGVTERS